MQVAHLCKVGMDIHMPPSYNMKGPAIVEKRKRNNAERSIFSVCQIVISPSQIRKALEFGKTSFEHCKDDKVILYAVLDKLAISVITSISTKPTDSE